MKAIVLGLLLAASHACFGGMDTNTLVVGDWSEAVKGVRGRLLFSPDRTIHGTGVAAVYLELQNVSGSDFPVRIYYDPEHTLRCELLDAFGNPVPGILGNYAHAAVGPYWIVLPIDSSLKMRVSGGGYGGKGGLGICVNPPPFWVIPEDSSAKYSLSGTFTVPPPKDYKNYRDWLGTLKLPKIQVSSKYP